MGFTYRTEQLDPLTAQEIDDNFRHVAELTDDVMVAKGESEAARDAAVTAKNAAQSSASASASAKNAAEQARDTATQKASAASQSAAAASSSATAAQGAKDTAVTAKNDAQSAATTAVTAKGEAGAARDTAVDSAHTAVSAKEASEVARDTAVNAKNAAQSAASTATQQASIAKNEADRAEVIASTLEISGDIADLAGTIAALPKTKPTLNLDFINQKQLLPMVEFTRASKDWDSQGREYGINEPVLTDEGLWVSGARTNLLLESKKFDTWTKTNSTVSIEREGYRLSDLGDSYGTHALVSVPVSTPQGSELTFSLVVEAPSNGLLELRGEQSARWDVRPAVMYDFKNMTATPQSSGPESTGSIKKIGINRYVVACTGKLKEDVIDIKFGVFLVNELGDTNYTPDPLNTIYVDLFSAQVEVGKVSTPHIPTKGSQVTVAPSGQLVPLNRDDVKRSTFVIDFTPIGLSIFSNVTGFFGVVRTEGQRNAISLTGHTGNMRVTFYDISNNSFSLFDFELGRRYVLAITLNGDTLAVWSGGEKMVEGEFLGEVVNDFNVLTLGNHDIGRNDSRGETIFHNVAAYNSVLPDSHLAKLTELTP